MILHSCYGASSLSKQEPSYLAIIYYEVRYLGFLLSIFYQVVILQISHFKRSVFDSYAYCLRQCIV